MTKALIMAVSEGEKKNHTDTRISIARILDFIFLIQLQTSLGYSSPGYTKVTHIFFIYP